MADVKLIIDGAALEAMLKGPGGVVWPFLLRNAEVFQAAAKAQAPRKTGCLADSIVKRIEDAEGELAIRFVCDTTPCSPTRTSYALFVHDGTQPHDISPRNGNVLAFYWPNGPQGPGMYFFAGTVHHPGTKANKFFTDNLNLLVHA